MKERTFFTTFLLFLLFFNTAILLITSAMLKDNLQALKERCLAEHYVIATSLIKDMQALETRDANTDTSLRELMGAYTYFSQNRKIRLAVFHENALLFSSAEMDEAFSFDPSQAVLENRMLFIENKKHPALSIAGRLPQPFQGYLLFYQYNLEDSIASWRQMKNALYLAGSLFSVLLALCLLLLLERIFRPLGQIAKASQSIAAGNYESRLPVSGHDELTDMSQSFNHMADEIQTQIAALQEAAEQKQRFIDNFAHELRTPLTTIYGYTEMIQKTSMKEADKLTATNYILTECNRMQHMACQLLDMAFLRNGEILLEDVSLSALFHQVETAIRPKTTEKELTVTYENELGRLNGNPDLLQILLLNLIDNAVKACRAKGRILVRGYRENENPVLSVQDNGKGMSQEQLAHIKEAFYRVDKARNRKDGGAGLGLSLCEQIAEIHHAHMRFFSSPQEGTVVKVIFTSRS